ncbi:hypothetical protein TWF696_007963 [Orbilia brochopaga]|uniref:Uncharacterized protein n=1 Tax=Orbilia brochopaga TaxID=3140254 RepID=A0AAV9UN61_9PEZI
MKVPTLLTTALFLRVVAAQTSDTTVTNASTTTSSDSTSSTTTSEVDTLVTLAPDACAAAGLESCYNILEIIAPTVYVIFTLEESDVPESLAAEETIASGDPILTQTDNIVTATDEIIIPPTTAVVRISYSESSGTTCDDATITSTLTNSDDPECAQSTAAFFTPPPQVTKTRVFIKAKEDDTQRKGTDGGGDNIASPTNGGGGSSPNPSPARPTDAAGPTNDTNEPVLSPTDGGSPTEGSSPPENGSPTQNSNGSPTENSNGSPTDNTNGSPTQNDSPSSNGGGGSGGGGSAPRPTDNQTGPGGSDESGKPELSTSFVTIAEVTNGSTRFVTSAVATMTRSSTVQATGAANSNNMVKAELLLGAVGLAAAFGV